MYIRIYIYIYIHKKTNMNLHTTEHIFSSKCMHPHPHSLSLYLLRHTVSACATAHPGILQSHVSFISSIPPLASFSFPYTQFSCLSLQKYPLLPLIRVVTPPLLLLFSSISKFLSISCRPSPLSHPPLSGRQLCLLRPHSAAAWVQSERATAAIDTRAFVHGVCKPAHPFTLNIAMCSVPLCYFRSFLQVYSQSPVLPAMSWHTVHSRSSFFLITKNAASVIRPSVHCHLFRPSLLNQP